MYVEHEHRLSLPIPAVSLTLPDDHRDAFLPSHSDITRFSAPSEDYLAEVF